MTSRKGASSTRLTATFGLREASFKSISIVPGRKIIFYVL